MDVSLCQGGRINTAVGKKNRESTSIKVELVMRVFVPKTRFELYELRKMLE